jgi:transcription initiation factor IIE alpha subunit
LPPGSQQQQKLRVCEACGSFLSIFDNDRRLADHFGGKMHAGYQSVRDKIKTLEAKLGAAA